MAVSSASKPPPLLGSPAKPAKLPGWALAYMGLLLAWLAIEVLSMQGPLKGSGMLLIAVMSLGAIVFAILRYRPAHAWTWWLASAAFLLFLVGGVARVELHTLGNLSSNRPLLPDLVVMPGYILLGAALTGFSTVQTRGQHRTEGILLDGVMAGLAILALSWVYTIEPLQSESSALRVTIILAIYPTLSAALLVTTIRLALAHRSGPTIVYTTLLTAMSSMFVGDAFYMFAEIHELKVSSFVLDLPYSIAYLAAAACVLHPRMRELTNPVLEYHPRPLVARIAIVATSFLILPILLLRSNAQRSNQIVLMVILILLAISGLTRLIQALRDADRSHSALTFQAHHDHLTGLLNRQMIHDRLAELLRHLEDSKGMLAVLFIDLDRFKLINDMLGHGYGDQLLVEVAQRLDQSVSEGALVGRIGGDEFLALLCDLPSADAAIGTAYAIRNCLRKPFILEDETYHIASSIGVAIANPELHPTPDSLIRDADIAMYRAKDEGPDAVVLFDTPMRTKVVERAELENDLHDALDRNQFHLLYQPVVELSTKRLVGVEALVRWSHPKFGELGPSKFIPLAEDTGLIVDIGHWVLKEALRQSAYWRAEFIELMDLQMAVNLSMVQLRSNDIVAEIKHILETLHLPGSALCVEITESTLMADKILAARELGELRLSGVHVAIDDFGTEYSSLAYLKTLPVDLLKIDRSFVDSLADHPSANETLIAAIVAMANALGMETIAEGVEFSYQAERLTLLGCNMVQGFLYSRPVAPESIPELALAMAEPHGEPLAPAGSTEHHQP